MKTNENLDYYVKDGYICAENLEYYRICVMKMDIYALKDEARIENSTKL